MLSGGRARVGPAVSLAVGSGFTWVESAASLAWACGPGSGVVLAGESQPDALCFWRVWRWPGKKGPPVLAEAPLGPRWQWPPWALAGSGLRCAARSMLRALGLRLQMAQITHPSVRRGWPVGRVCSQRRTGPVTAEAQVLSPAVQEEAGAQVTEFFIDVARTCFNAGNLNSLVAIVCE